MGFEEFKDTGVQDVLMLHHEPTVDLFSSDPIPTRPSQRSPLSYRPSHSRTPFPSTTSSMCALNYIFITRLKYQTSM